MSAKVRNYCTFFDVNYLARGIAMYQSLLKESSIPIKLWALCMDAESFIKLTKAGLECMIPIALEDLEKADTELFQVKNNRSRIEYFFTCTPCLPLFILKNEPLIKDITYIDSDLYFYSDPEKIYSEIGDGSICVTPHRYSKRVSDGHKWGIYNVGFMYFRRDPNGMKCVNWWRERCLEWCYDRSEDGKFADQGYLNDWPERFESVKILDTPGINLAIWNVENTRLSWNGKYVFADGKKLIFYHFHLFREISRRLYKTNLENYGLERNKILLGKIYQPYANALFAISQSLGSPEKKELRYENKERITAPKKMSLLAVLKGMLSGKIVLGR
jgi:hypothetical protein